MGVTRKMDWNEVRNLIVRATPCLWRDEQGIWRVRLVCDYRCGDRTFADGTPVDRRAMGREARALRADCTEVQDAAQTAAA